jgi:CubicO group peptidase (beta-lactamase class C family)
MKAGHERVICSVFVIGILSFMLITPYALAIPGDSVCLAPLGTPAYWPTDGWLTSTPEEQGMNSTMLEMAGDMVVDRGWTIDSIVVIRHGYIVYEVYPNPHYNMNTAHPLASATKSITGALIGIALGRGDLTSLDAKVVDFFPERTIANLDENKEAMTVEDLLTMASGLDFHEDTEPSDVFAILEPIDYLQYVLDLPMLYPPGVNRIYSSGDSHILSGIINATTGMSALNFGLEALFQPLGISKVEWKADYAGTTRGMGWLNLTSRDMAKIGYLYLNNGTWDGQQVIPSEYIHASLQPHDWNETRALPFGYHWWIDESVDAFTAQGAAQQRIWVQPKNDLVVVITTTTFKEDLSPPDTPMYGNSDVLIKQIILPAILEPATTPPPTSSATNGSVPAFPLLVPIAGLAVGTVIVVAAVLVARQRKP